MLIDSMVASGQLKEELRFKVREAMLKRHHHQNERKLSNRIPLVRSIADIGKKHSDPHLLDRNGEKPHNFTLVTYSPEFICSIFNSSRAQTTILKVPMFTPSPHPWQHKR